MELLDRLESLANLKEGELAPEWLAPNAWGPGISQLCREAAAEIKHLRRLSGAVTQGHSFGQIKTHIQMSTHPSADG